MNVCGIPCTLLKEVGLLALEELHHVVECTNARIICVITFSHIESQTKCSPKKYQKTWWLAHVVVIRQTQSHVLLKNVWEFSDNRDLKIEVW